jgi:hypothetical protein
MVVTVVATNRISSTSLLLCVNDLIQSHSD